MPTGDSQPSSSGFPSDWFVALSDDSEETASEDGIEVSIDEFEGESPTRWEPAEREAPEATDRLLRLYMVSVEDFAGDAETVRGRVRLEVSIDGSPRELRFWTAAGHWNTLLLWSDANIDLWVEGLALQEMQRQRLSPSEVEVDEPEGLQDEDDWRDPDDFTFVPLAKVRPQLALKALDRYVPLFLRFGRFRPEYFDEARASVALDVTTDAERPILRCTSHFTGETRWLYDWDESDQAAIAFVEEQAYDHGDWVDRERVLNGPTEWD